MQGCLSRVTVRLPILWEDHELKVSNAFLSPHLKIWKWEHDKMQCLFFFCRQWEMTISHQRNHRKTSWNCFMKKKVKYRQKKRKVYKWIGFKKYIFFRKHIEVSTQLVQAELCNNPFYHKAITQVIVHNSLRQRSSPFLYRHFGQGVILIIPKTVKEYHRVLSWRWRDEEARASIFT